MKVKQNTSLILRFFALPLNVFSLILASVLILAFFVLSICFVNVGYAADRNITLLWDESIDAPYLQSYKVYYYTTSQNPESLNAADYAVSYTLVGGNPISLNPLTDPKPITIDKTNTQITLHFSNDTITYYFVLTAIDTRGLESIPTPEVFAQRTGSIMINGGAVATNNSSVTISLSAVGFTQMQFSNDNISWSSAEAYATTKQWQLTSGEGVKTIYAKFKDSLDVWSTPCLATITLDTTPPTVAISNPSVTTTTSGPVTYTVTYAGASSISLTSTGVTLIKSGTADGAVAVSGTGNTSRMVTISGIAGTGSLGIAIAAGTASDAAGNQAGASGTSVAFNVENQQAPVYLSSRVTQGNIPGLSVIVVNSANVIVAVCDVADDGTWVSQLLPAGQYGWYIVYGNLISAKNATTFNTALLKSISGTITGLPADGGAVTVRSVNGNLQKTIAVQANGAYTVTNLVPAIDYQVSVVAENIPVTYYSGKTDISEASYVNISSANATNINFTLTVPDSHITGTINDLTGSVAGLAVYAYEVNTSAMTYTRVLSDGTYDLKVKAGVYRVFVIKANNKIFYFYNEDGTPTQNEAYALARTITTAGQTVGHTNINITEGTQVLQGKVTYRTANGNPVANVLVVASTQMEKSLAVTDINGRYTISGLQNGTAYTVSMKTLSGNYPVQTTSIVAGTDMTRDFIIGIGAVLSGTITSQADPTKKVAGALVYIKDQTTGLLVGGRVYYSGADGTYSLYDNQSGNYTLEVFHPDYRSYSANIVIGASNVNHDVSMETGASFKGTVKDISGNPLSGATVIVSRVGSASIYTTTNSAGSYNIYGLDATKSDYTVTAQKKDYDRQIVMGRQPALDGAIVDFSLSRPTITYQVSGIVMTSDNNPLQNATVLVSSPLLNFSASTTTAADGSYAVSGLINTGNYTITVLPSGNLPLRSTTFTINNADVSINFTIALGNQIGGYLFGSPAFPIGQDVYVFLYQGTQYIGYTKAIAGTFTFQGLTEANNYKILATAQGYTNQWYTGQSDITTANTIASGNVSVNLTLNAAP